MRVLVVEPEHRPEVRKIDDSLTAMQEIVGGLIQSVYLDGSVALVCHDEGKLMNLPANRALRDENGQIYDIVCRWRCNMKVQAYIHSLKDHEHDRQGEAEIIECIGDNLYLAEANGIRCTAIFNFFTGAYYVDDVYGNFKRWTARWNLREDF